MQELIQEIQAQPTHRLRYRMQLARLRGEHLAGWRARSVQTRKSARLHPVVNQAFQTAEAGAAHTKGARHTLWLN